MAKHNNLEQLFDALQKKIDKALQTEVAEEAKKLERESLDELVYSHPAAMYERRGAKGGLLDARNIKAELAAPATLIIENNAPFNPISNPSGGFYNNAFPVGYDLADVVEYGNAGGLIPNPPRPFQTDAGEKLSKGGAAKALKKGLEKQGLNVINKGANI
jgi:hypothetical protein